ncbi:hypothetical protein M9Y10_005090 [Tritrichomonas musculus]|uniref:Initiator binding domain-containing protein n=1 Tax=Tritrichomonas musculus TaxID=1915356 RepID=A0ABR2JKV2_9EUKA
MDLFSDSSFLSLDLEKDSNLIFEAFDFESQIKFSSPSANTNSKTEQQSGSDKNHKFINGNHLIQPNQSKLINSVNEIKIAPSQNQRLSSTSFKEQTQELTPTIEKFEAAMADKSLIINPKKMGFIPSSFWTDKEILFSDVVSDFFQRKNNSNCRFIHKLYNALRMVEFDSKFIPIVGIQWINDSILRINRIVIAKLLRIKAIEGSLFHQQGNFPSHGFVELEPADVRKIYPNFDFSIDRLLTHKDHIFVKGCTEEEVLKCKWKQ